jgi:hypothetical protein
MGSLIRRRYTSGKVCFFFALFLIATGRGREGKENEAEEEKTEGGGRNIGGRRKRRQKEMRRRNTQQPPQHIPNHSAQHSINTKKK